MIFKNSIQSLKLRSGCILLALTCWASLGLSASLAQEASLAWKFEQGDQFQVTTTKISNRTSALDSRISTIRSNVTIEFNWTVDSVDDDGTATITQELKNFSIDIGDPAVPAQAIAYSSDVKPADLPLPMRKLQRKSKPLIGLTCVLKMASNGEVKSVQLTDDGQEKLDALANAPNLQALFSKESLEKLSSEFALNAVPSDATSSGWSKTEIEQGGFGKVSIDHKFSIGPEEMVKGRKLIEITVASSLTPNDTDDSTDDLKAKNEISQSLISYTGKGSITFDVASEYFSNSQFKTQVKSERQYREKLIMTSLENESRTTIEKQ